ncbi:MAG: hypothetical protein WC483_03350 [Candidatus Paceibacterota bacterium]
MRSRSAIASIAAIIFLRADDDDADSASDADDADADSAFDRQK